MSERDREVLEGVPASDDPIDFWITARTLSDKLEYSHETVKKSLLSLFRSNLVKRQKKDSLGQPYEYQRTPEGDNRADK